MTNTLDVLICSRSEENWIVCDYRWKDKQQQRRRSCEFLSKLNKRLGHLGNHFRQRPTRSKLIHETAQKSFKEAVEIRIGILL